YNQGGGDRDSSPFPVEGTAGLTKIGSDPALEERRSLDGLDRGTQSRAQILARFQLLGAGRALIQMRQHFAAFVRGETVVEILIHFQKYLLTILFQLGVAHAPYPFGACRRTPYDCAT